MKKLFSLAALGLAAAPGPGELFDKPVPLSVDGAPIEGQVGHLAPYVSDWNGDGVRDLLVGQFGGGKLAIYINEGSDTAPRYAAAEWFQAGGTTGTVPAG